jgi:threonine/homoserine/homoserine lactone efflux protein
LIDTASYLAYLSFTFVLVVTPGSTTAVVLRNTLDGGRRAGYATAVGAATANSLIAISCGLGLSVLLAYWPGSLEVIRYGGAAFLAWLGLSSLWRVATLSDGGIRLTPNVAHHSGTQLVSYFRDGLGINLLSPVIISFYLTVVPSFMPPGARVMYYALLAVSHVGLALFCHSMWATALDVIRHWFAPPAARRALQAATGLALIALAIRVAI